MQETLSSESYHHFCKALCCEFDWNNDTPPLKTAVEHLSRLYLLLTKSLQSQAGEVYDSELHDIMLLVDRFVTCWSAQRYFCSDDSSRLGWVPRKAQVGDVFCVFLGARVPHLLRPLAHARYELIGECYLQGCMNGEVMEAGNFATEEFVIV